MSKQVTIQNTGTVTVRARAYPGCSGYIVIRIENGEVNTASISDSLWTDCSLSGLTGTIIIFITVSSELKDQVIYIDDIVVT